MARPIDAEKLEDHINATKDTIMSTQNDVVSASAKGAAIGVCQAILEVVDEQPTIEAEPVRHGEWHECWHTDAVCASICTNCGKVATQARVSGSTNVLYPLCPYCGAYMGEVNKDAGTD